MDDFDTFKASREKIDPSCRKFTERQWQKAYAAHLKARKRVAGKRSKETSSTSSRRSRSESGHSRHVSMAGSPPLNLRNEVRQNSAYSDLRMIVDLLAWVAIGVAVLAAGVKIAYYTDGSIALGAVLNATIMVIAILVLRLLAHVIIDIPDIALHERFFKQTNSRREPRDNAKDSSD